MHKRAPAAELKRARSLGAEIQREQATPEQQGHAAATALRRDLGLDGQPIAGGLLSRIVEGCGLQLLEAEEPDVCSLEVRSFVACSKERGSLLYLRQTPALKKSWARRFETCRGLGVSMLDPYRSGLLGRASCPWSSSYSRRRSGAFAAELLLPAGGIREKGLSALDSASNPAAFTGLMAEYGVGATAAAWQLWNLGLLSSPDLRDALIEEYSAGS